MKNNNVEMFRKCVGEMIDEHLQATIKQLWKDDPYSYLEKGKDIDSSSPGVKKMWLDAVHSGEFCEGEIEDLWFYMSQDEAAAYAYVAQVIKNVW